GSIGTVVHFGTFRGDDPLEGYKRMIDTLNDILSRWDGNSLILIENNAGKGDQLGLTLEELVKIRQLTDYPEKVGFCFDTCHAFAAGLWAGENWKEVMDNGKELGYFQHLKAVHLNNSVYPYHSRHDRHANIKSGEIPLDHILKFCTSEVIKNLPLILETPSSSQYSHVQEITDLKSWVIQNPNNL
ncbi:MAG: deoxyribonuclease IV, partial [Tuberibacillus sp.]